MVKYIHRSKGEGEFWEFRGTSDEAKPTENVPYGSQLIEMDTSTIYFFDGTNWLKWGN